MKMSTVLKNLPTGWAEEAEAMDEAQLRDVIVESSNNIHVTRLEMQENPGVKDAKEKYKDAAGPFRDAIKAQNAKIAYALAQLESKGKI